MLRHALVWFGWVGAAAAGAMLAYVAFWQEPRTTSLTALGVESPAWPAESPPLRVAFVSDIHVDGAHTTPDRTRRLVEAVNHLDPDVILLGGDFIGGLGFKSQYRRTSRPRRTEAGVARDEEAIRLLGGLRAPEGVFAVFGNHDCWWDCDRIRELLEGGGISVLSNQSTQIMRPEGAYWIIGMADKQTQDPDFEAAFAGVPENAPTLLLMHNPQLFDWPQNDAPIQFAGHTHGGQVRFPFIGAPLRMSRHTEEAISGAMVEQGRVLIVSRGFGEVGLPVRFGAPPEIMLVEIRHGPVARIARGAGAT